MISACEVCAGGLTANPPISPRRWTRAAVVALWARGCHVEVSLTTFGRYLKA